MFDSLWALWVWGCIFFFSFGKLISIVFQIFLLSGLMFFFSGDMLAGLFSTALLFSGYFQTILFTRLLGGDRIQCPFPLIRTAGQQPTPSCLSPTAAPPPHVLPTRLWTPFFWGACGHLSATLHLSTMTLPPQKCPLGSNPVSLPTCASRHHSPMDTQMAFGNMGRGWNCRSFSHKKKPSKSKGFFLYHSEFTLFTILVNTTLKQKN